MPARALTVAMKTSDAGVLSSANLRVSVRTMPPFSRRLSMRTQAFNPGKSRCSANPSVEINAPMRASADRRGQHDLHGQWQRRGQTCGRTVDPCKVRVILW